MTFRVGQKVVCVDDTGLSSRPENKPVKGHIYTIRNIVGPCIRLREIVNVPAQYAEGMGECSFKATRFVAKTGRK